MLDILSLRKDLDAVVARLEKRKSPQPYLDVAAFSALETERKTLQIRTEHLQSERKRLSKEIGIHNAQANRLLAADDDDARFMRESSTKRWPKSPPSRLSWTALPPAWK